MASVFCGDSGGVRAMLEEMAGELGIGELMVNTIVWDHAEAVAEL